MKRLHRGRVLHQIGLCILSVALATGAMVASAQQLPPASVVRVYPAPPGGIPPAPDFEMTVNGQEVPVYRVEYATHHEFIPCTLPCGSPSVCPEIPTEVGGFGSFDADGPVTVAVKVKNRGAVTGARIVPASAAITPSVSGNVVTMVVRRPGKYELQVNGSDRRVLYIFANPLEVNPPRPGDPNVIYYGPGVHRPGTVTLRAGQTVYIHGSAIVKGRFSLVPPVKPTTPIRNVTIRGRGIIDTSGFPTHSGTPVHFSNIGGTTFSHPTRFLGTDGLSLEGFIIFDSPGWTLAVFHSQYVVIDNVKVIGNHRQNADGIDIVSSQHVRVRNVFTRVWDDAICLKTMGDCNFVCNNYHTGGYVDWERNISDVRVTDSFITTDMGIAALEIGLETTSRKILNVYFGNIDIPHAYARSALGIRVYERAQVDNIIYRNIRIEDPKGTETERRWFVLEVRDHYHLLAKNCEGNQYVRMAAGVGDQVGAISNILFDNVRITRSQPLTSVYGQQGGLPLATVEATLTHPPVSGRIGGVKFRNLWINGQKVMTPGGAGFTGVPEGSMTFE